MQFQLIGLSGSFIKNSNTDRLVQAVLESNDLGFLPMPGRFVLDQKGNVVSTEANPDYTHRPEPSEIVESLEKNGLIK